MEILIKLMEWFEQNAFSGPDPYTIRGTKLNRFFIKSKNIGKIWDFLLSFLDTKILPFFIFDIQKIKSATSMALLAQTYFLLFKITQKNCFLRKGEALLKWLNDTKSQGYSGACWGLPFDWKIPYNEKGDYVIAKKGTPFPTIMTYIMDAFILGYELTNKITYLNTLLSTEAFFLKDLHIKESNGMLCASYSPIDFYFVNNVSSYVAAALCRLYKYSKSEKLLDYIRKFLLFLSSQQNDDGSWFYSKYRPIKDALHQCFILQNLLFVNNFIDDDDIHYTIRKGLIFLEKFKSENGLYRAFLNKKYYQLIDQAEILSLYLDLNIKNKYLELLNSIEKNLFYSKAPFFITIVSNKIKIRKPYLRWGLSQMAFALAKYFFKINTEK